MAELICRVALRNIATGALMGCLPVPAWNPDDQEDDTRDLVGEAFDAAYPDQPIRPWQRASDGSCGTFTMGPLVGLWEWLDFGEEPVQTWGPAWTTRVYQKIVDAAN